MAEKKRKKTKKKGRPSLLDIQKRNLRLQKQQRVMVEFGNPSPKLEYEDAVGFSGGKEEKKMKIEFEGGIIGSVNLRKVRIIPLLSFFSLRFKGKKWSLSFNCPFPLSLSLSQRKNELIFFFIYAPMCLPFINYLLESGQSRSIRSQTAVFKSLILSAFHPSLVLSSFLCLQCPKKTSVSFLYKKKLFLLFTI